MPRMAPLRKTFSRPVSSGWKPVPTSSNEPTRPQISARPSVGSVMRARILSTVLLPAPLRPTIPSVSPGSSSKVTSFRAQIVWRAARGAAPTRRRKAPVRLSRKVL